MILFPVTPRQLFLELSSMPVVAQDFFQLHQIKCLAFEENQQRYLFTLAYLSEEIPFFHQLSPIPQRSDEVERPLWHHKVKRNLLEMKIANKAEISNLLPHLFGACFFLENMFTEDQDFRNSAQNDDIYLRQYRACKKDLSSSFSFFFFSVFDEYIDAVMTSQFVEEKPLIASHFLLQSTVFVYECLTIFKGNAFISKKVFPEPDIFMKFTSLYSKGDANQVVQLGFFIDDQEIVATQKDYAKIRLPRSKPRALNESLEPSLTSRTGALEGPKAPRINLSKYSLLSHKDIIITKAVSEKFSGFPDSGDLNPLSETPSMTSIVSSVANTEKSSRTQSEIFFEVDERSLGLDDSNSIYSLLSRQESSISINETSHQSVDCYREIYRTALPQREDVDESNDYVLSGALFSSLLQLPFKVSFSSLYSVRERSLEKYQLGVLKKILDKLSDIVSYQEIVKGDRVEVRVSRHSEPLSRTTVNLILLLSLLNFKSSFPDLIESLDQ